MFFPFDRCFAAFFALLAVQRSGKTYGPPSSKRLIYFVDDLNMPFIEEYGTQTPIALLRQYMDYRGWVTTRHQSLLLHSFNDSGLPAMFTTGHQPYIDHLWGDGGM